MSLTKYSVASLGELWGVSLPLMISFFAAFLMLFFDRLFLASYSSEALNACVNAAMLGWSFIAAVMVLAGIAEVFVAQHNGAGNYYRIGEPVWQMIWFAIFSCIFFLPMAVWGSKVVFANMRYENLSQVYFRWMMLFGPFFCFNSALSAFFIGRGKIFIVTSISIIANIVNIILDYIFIFGVSGICPSLGIKGAAIATGIGEVFIVIVLALFFLRAKYADKYGTRNWKFNKLVFIKCLKVGIPQAIAVSLEVFGWTLFYWLLTDLGEDMITVASICQSFNLLFWFFSEGTSRGVSVVVGNLIGAKSWNLIPRVFWQGIKLNIIFISFVMVFFLLGADFFVRAFAKDILLDTNTLSTIKISLFISIFYLLFEGIKFVSFGVLTAAGDTSFNMIASALSVWAFLLLPLYLLVVKGNPNIILAILITLTYSVAAALLFVARFFQGKWRSATLLE